MYLIKAGDLEVQHSIPIEVKRKAKDFEKAKQIADKLSKNFAQVEVIDEATSECVYFLSKDSN